jgi:hypothetical protein
LGKKLFLRYEMKSTRTDAGGNDRFRVVEKLPASCIDCTANRVPYMTITPPIYSHRSRPCRELARLALACAVAACGAEAGGAGVGGAQRRGRSAMSSKSDALSPAAHPSDPELARQLDSSPSVSPGTRTTTGVATTTTEVVGEHRSLRAQVAG